MEPTIVLIAGITIKEGIRNRALHGIMAIALLLCLMFLTIVPLFAFETGKVAVDLGFASMTLAGLAIVIFLGIALLARDMHQRTVCMILSRPVSRTDYVVGKYIGLAVTVFIAVFGITALSVITSWLGILFVEGFHAPRNFSWTILVGGVLFQYLALLLLMAISFLFTCLTTNEYISMIITVCVFIIGNSLETIIQLIEEAQFVFTSEFYLDALKALAWLFPNFSAFDLKVYISYGLPLPLDYVFWTGLYGVLYITIIAFFTLWIFKRKEIG